MYFAKYCINKIDKIKDDIKHRITQDNLEGCASNIETLSIWRKISWLWVEYVKQHVMNMPTKNNELDPVPTWVVEAFINQQLVSHWQVRWPAWWICHHRQHSSYVAGREYLASLLLRNRQVKQLMTTTDQSAIWSLYKN